MMYVEQRVIIPEHLRCFCNEHSSAFLREVFDHGKEDTSYNWLWRAFHG